MKCAEFQISFYNCNLCFQLTAFSFSWYMIIVGSFSCYMIWFPGIWIQALMKLYI